MSECGPHTPDAIIAAIRLLGPAEQVDVYLALREELAALGLGPAEDGSVGDDIELSDEYRQELEARYAKYKADPESAITLEEFEAELDARLGDDGGPPRHR
jgi:hypothetical protein